MVPQERFWQKASQAPEDGECQGTCPTKMSVQTKKTPLNQERKFLELKCSSLSSMLGDLE